MVNRTTLWFLVAAFAAGFTGTVRADEISELRKQVEEQYNALRQVQTKLIEIESAQAKQGESVKKLESGGGFALPDSLKWAEKVSFYGDFRYRHEQIDGESTDQRDRHRIRARLGLRGKIADEWSFDLRLASGSADPISTNQDLGGGFSSKTVWLDSAFLTFKPQSIEGLSVLAGKMANPFYTVGGNQLMWDGDLNPEGMAVKYTAKLNDADTFFANAGGMWVQRDSTSQTDISLWAIQGGLTHAFEDKSKLTGGLGYFKYGNIQDKRAIYDTAKNFGNSTYNDGAHKRYLYDYELVEAFGEYATRLGDVPVSFYGDYVVNTASGVSGDTGWLVGTTYNKAGDPGTWQVGYEYRELERDAVLGAFTDSDFIGGGTHGKGHKFSFKYALAKNVSAGTTYFLNEHDADGGGKRDDKYRRLQLDVELKF
jgi:hypothetical protein